MAARRALEWIRMSNAQLVLDMKYQTCYAVHLDVDVQWNFSIPDTLGLACYKDAHICDRI